MNRFSKTDVSRWRDEGFAVLPDFFSQAEISPIVADFKTRYGMTGKSDGRAVDHKAAGEIGVLGEFRDLQFQNIDSMPYQGSIEFNLISLHPALIRFAKALLGVDRVHLYQSHTWAKFTGETDYDQAFHCDFANHTLLVPADEPALRTVDFVIYLTDVTDAHGAMHYVTKQDSERILGPGRIGADDPEKQAALKQAERSAASPAGTLLAHGIDTFHRGTNLTAEKGYRYTMTVGYKAAGNDTIGYHTWQQTRDNDWSPVLSHGTPEQLSALGIPEPGDPYWTLRTLKLTQARWHEWDMSEYFRAAGL